MSQPPRTEADVLTRAAEVGLDIDPAFIAAVAQHLTGLMAAVSVVDEFPLPESTEPAPSFEP
jgi:1-carboxybiuret hydrolase subunit AtzG-like protein